MSTHYGSQLLAFPCSLPLALTKKQSAYIFLFYVTILLSVVCSEKKKVFRFSLSIFKEISKFQNRLAAWLTTRLSLLLAWPDLALAPKRLSLSLVAPGIFTWLECEELAPQEATRTLQRTVLQNLPVTHRKRKSNLHSRLRERAQWSGAVTCRALDSPSCDW